MREMIKMVVVLTVLSLSSGGILAALQESTKPQIELQELKFVKGPAIEKILDDVANDPLNDRFKIEVDGKEKAFYVGVVDGQPKLVAFEGTGKGGYGGDVGLMIGVNVETDEIVGVQVTTHSETPGLGARAKDDPGFVAQFQGYPLAGECKVKPDGGKIDAISGATITSRAVCGGVSQAGNLYKELKPRIESQLKDLKQG